MAKKKTAAEILAGIPPTPDPSLPDTMTGLNRGYEPQVPVPSREMQLEGILNRDPQQIAAERYDKYMGKGAGKVGKKILDVFLAGLSGFGKNPYYGQYQTMLGEERETFKQKAPLAQQELNTIRNTEQRDAAARMKQDVDRERLSLEEDKAAQKFYLEFQKLEQGGELNTAKIQHLKSLAELTNNKAGFEKAQTKFFQEKGFLPGRESGAGIRDRTIAADPNAATGFATQEILKNIFKPRSGEGTSVTTRTPQVPIQGPFGITGYQQGPPVTSTTQRAGRTSPVDMSIIPGLISGNAQQKQDLIKQILTGQGRTPPPPPGITGTPPTPIARPTRPLAIAPAPVSGLTRRSTLFPPGVGATGAQQKTFRDATNAVAEASSVRNQLLTADPKVLESFLGPVRNLQIDLKIGKIDATKLRNLLVGRSKEEVDLAQALNSAQWSETVKRTGAQLSENELKMAGDITPNLKTDRLPDIQRKAIIYELLQRVNLFRGTLPPRTVQELMNDSTHTGRVRELVNRYTTILKAGGKLPENAFAIETIYPELTKSILGAPKKSIEDKTKSIFGGK